MKRLIFSTGCMLGIISLGSALNPMGSPEGQAWAQSVGLPVPYKSDLSSSELRRTTAELLRYLELRNGTPSGSVPVTRGPEVRQLEETSLRLLMTYRKGATNSASASGASSPLSSPSVGQSPSLDFLIGSRWADLYQQAFDARYQEEFNRVVVGMPLDLLFDGLLSAIVARNLPPEIAEQTREIDACLASRALELKSEENATSSCPLDLTETLTEPSVFLKVRMKLACSLGRKDLISSCDARQTLFALAKPKLLDARKLPEVKKLFEEKLNEAFGPEFAEKFVPEVSKKSSGFADTLLKKLKIKKSEFFGPGFPLLESDYSNSGVRSMQGFAEGLGVDTLAADLLLESDRTWSSELRSLGGALFLGASQRLMLLTGGKVALRDSRNEFQTEMIADRPMVKTRPWGGLSLNPESGLLGNWDWLSYEPDQTLNGASSLRLFPETFSVGSQGLPQLELEPRQKLRDLADLLSSVSQYLQKTKSGPDRSDVLPRARGLSRYFGPDQRITDLFDPNQPMIFPESGRLLALGVAVGVLKNITSEKFGHLEQKQIGDPNFGLGIEFYDTVSKAGRLDRRPSIETLSRLLVALSDFKDAIRGDPSIPPAVTDLVPQFQLLIDLGTLYLGAQAQSETGAFDSLVGASDVNSHRLQSQIHGLRALTSAFDLSERAVYQLRLEAGWKFLDRFWRETPDSKERALPVWREQDLPQVRIDAQPIDPSRVWELLNFWEETQLKVRPALEQSGIDWKLWEQRFERIRVRLLAQMRTTEGPARWVVEQ